MINGDVFVIIIFVNSLLSLLAAAFYGFLFLRFIRLTEDLLNEIDEQGKLDNNQTETEDKDNGTDP